MSDNLIERVRAAFDEFINKGGLNIERDLLLIAAKRHVLAALDRPATDAELIDKCRTDMAALGYGDRPATVEGEVTPKLVPVTQSDRDTLLEIIEHWKIALRLRAR